MLESRNVDHMKSSCSWDMFFWKNQADFAVSSVSRK